MEFEATTSTAAVQSTAGDSMTIDYDMPDPSHPAEGADAEMGDDLPKDTDLTALEADMVDDDALIRDAAATGEDGDAEIVIDEDVVDLTSSAPLDIPFSAAEPAPTPPFSAFSSAPIVSTAPFSTVAVVDLASEPVLTIPEPAFSAAIPADPTLASAPLAIPTPVEPALPMEAAEPVLASLGDGGAAARAVEPLEEELAPEAIAAVAPADEAALAEVLDLVPNEDEATNEGLPEAVIETAGTGEAEVGEPSVQECTDAVEPRAEPSATDGAIVPPEHEGPSSRPLVNKDPLLDIDVPVRSPADASSSARGVPAVFLSMGAPHGWTTYSLFHAEQRIADEQDEHVKEDVELLLGEAAQHELYYQPLATLFGALRRQLDFLEHDGDELVLEFDEIGLTISEDNLYAGQVTLFDFDRIHTGCQIPGRLHANLATQPRFSAGFNALALHIAGSLVASADEGDEGGYVDEEGDESATLQGDEDELAELVDGELDLYPAHELDDAERERAGEGPADDHDGPDSELVGAQEDEAHAEDEFDLESALAQLDGDDVVAVIEGAQEDLLLAGGGEEAGEEPQVEEPQTAVARGEPQEDSAQEGTHEEVLEQAHEVAQEVPDEETNKARPRHGEGQEEGQVIEVVEAGEQLEGGEEAEQEPEEGLVEELKPEDAEEKEDPTAAPQDAVVEAEPVTATDNELVAPETAGHASATPTPDDQLATTEDSAVLEDAAPAEAGTPDLQEPQDAALEFAGATDAFATATEAPEEPANSTDVVIDYDDAFDGGPASAPPASPKDVVNAAALLAPLEPKRSREDDEQEGADEESAGDAKRPRLAEPLEVATA
ncbi:hypothetical protein JCM10449v2_005566 [Rhodotorula kratochvilovae]